MKNVYLVVLVVFGFFLMSMTGYACNSHSEKKSCSKMVSSAAGNMDCCKDSHHSKNEKHDCCKGKQGCNGKCGRSNCTTASIQFGVVFFDTAFKNNNLFFFEKKQNYSNSNTNLSSGFYSLWLIPKIS